MSAPGPRPDIESTLADAFARRHADQRAARPSLVDVRRRAHRRSTRNAAVRTGAVVVAGVAVVAGGWSASRPETPTVAAPAVPTDDVAPPDASSDPMVVTLSVEGLWNAVATEFSTTVDELRAANPSVDFTRSPMPGTPIIVPIERRPGTSSDATGPATTTMNPSPTFVNVLTVPPTTFVETTTTMSGPVVQGPPESTTLIVPAAGHECGPLTQGQIQELVDAVRAMGQLGHPTMSAPDGTVPLGCLGVPSIPEGWTLYQIATGDYLVRIAQQFCTSPEEIASANGWSGPNEVIYPNKLVAVPADAC